MTLAYEDRVLGDLRLSELTLEPTTGGGMRGRAGRATLNGKQWNDASFQLMQRRELIELGLLDTQSEPPWLTASHTSAERAALWTFALRHQALPRLLARFDVQLGAVLASTSGHATLTLVVPTENAKPASGRLELVLDHFPKPDWPQADLLFGDALSAAARVEPDQGRWLLRDVRLSSSLFTLRGNGSISWSKRPALALDATGALTCAQLRAQLPASELRDAITRFVAGRSERDRQSIELRIQVDVGNSAEDRARAAVALSAGCGQPARSEGEFVPPIAPRAR